MSLGILENKLGLPLTETTEDPHFSHLDKSDPKPDGAASIGLPCLGCGQFFRAGDVTTLISLGPGADAQQRTRIMRRQQFRAIAIELHWACATGEEL